MIQNRFRGNIHQTVVQITVIVLINPKLTSALHAVIDQQDIRCQLRVGAWHDLCVDVIQGQVNPRKNIVSRQIHKTVGGILMKDTHVLRACHKLRDLIHITFFFHKGTGSSPG